MPLVICSKSAWQPAIRREHSLAWVAASNGHPVTFIERPLDARALRTTAGARAWWRALRGVRVEQPSSPGVRVIPQATILPGHMNGPGEATGNLLLRRELRRVPHDAALVINVPWQWPATAGLPVRRVFDCADDWSELIPHRGSRLADLYRRIGREADAIIVANPSLADRFPSDRTTVVRNGVSDEMLGPLSRAASERRLVHTGTLTPRFDAALAADVLAQLHDWILDLYGQCQYPGYQERPGPELARLLSEYAPRVRWHGVVARQALPAAIDQATVALVLNRPERSLGQDSMKLYDYAARGRPIVTTRFSRTLQEDGPPHIRVADNAGDMAAAIVASQGEPDGWIEDRRRWADQQRWVSRWPAWSASLFGASG